LVLEVGGRRLVIVPVGGSPPGSAPPAPERLDLVKGLDSGLVAFDLATGREAWRASAELASYSTPLAARIEDRDVVLAWMRDHFLVVDPAGGAVLGRLRWRDDQVFSVVAASPVVRGVEALLSECYGPGSVVLDLARLAAGDGPAVVRQDRPKARPDRSLKAHWATPVLHEAHVYGSSGRNSGDAGLVCVDWKTGEVAWSTAGFGRASVALVGGHLIVLGEFGDLALVEANPVRYVEVSRTRLVDPAVGAGRAAELLAPPCWAAPVVARGLLYVRGRGRLVCVDLLDAP
jgi:outer membrane protein assembly factor BamB